MLKAGRALKDSLFTNMMHITCLAHACHRVAELVRLNNRHFNEVASNLKKIFIKCERRRNMFATETGISIPKFPIYTRWGTWINFCAFLVDNYDVIKEFVTRLDDDEAEAVSSLKSSFRNPQVESELAEIMKTKKICTTILSLEKQGLSIHEQKKLIDDLRNDLPPIYVAKLDNLLSNNPDYTKIFNFDNFEDRKNLNFAPLVSTDVERYFSKLKMIFTDHRQSFTENNFIEYSIVQCNSKFFY